MSAQEEAGAIPDHLTETITDRGFAHLPMIDARGPHGVPGESTVRVYESSAVLPSIWLSVVSRETPMDEKGRILGTSALVEATLHLSIETAELLQEQLAHLIARRTGDDQSWREEECFRTSGEVLCPLCRQPYWRHRQVAKEDAPTLVRACDGRLLKL